MGKYCQSCGSKTLPSDNFCGGCGNPLKYGLKKSDESLIIDSEDTEREIIKTEFHLDPSQVKIQASKNVNRLSFKDLVASVASGGPPEQYVANRQKDKLFSKDKKEFLANLQKECASARNKSKDSMES